MMNAIEKLIEFVKNRYNRHYREKKIHLAVDVVLALIILILAVFVIALKFGDFSPKNKLDLTVTLAGEKIISGQEAIFTVKYANVSKFNLLDTKFSFNPPENFILKEVSPEIFFDKRTNSFAAGELIPGANGAAVIKGLFIGEAGSAAKLIFNVSYLAAGKFSNELFSKNLTIDSSGLEVGWENSTVLFRRQPAAMSLNIKNISQFDMDDLEFIFLNQDGDLSLVYDGHDVEAAAGIRIKQLKAGADLKLNFELIYAGDKSETEVKISGRAVVNGQAIKHSWLREIFIIKEPDLSVIIEPSQLVVNIDDYVIYKISLKNFGSKDLNRLVLDLSSGDDKHSLTSVKMKNFPFIRLAGNRIIFEKNLRSKEEQEIELTVKFSRAEIFIGDQVRLKAAAVYLSDGAALKANYFSSPAKIKTTYQFIAETRYYSLYGDQLGVGPIPPLPGIPTKYWIFLQLKNHGNELSNLKVSAELPAGVIWSDESSLSKGNFEFDGENKLMAWSVDTLDGLEEDCRLALALTVIPDVGSAKTDILLLRSIKYEFLDNSTREVISNTVGNIFNDLSGDSYAVMRERKNNR